MPYALILKPRFLPYRGHCRVSHGCSATLPPGLSGFLHMASEARNIQVGAAAFTMTLDKETMWTQ